MVVAFEMLWDLRPIARQEVMPGWYHYVSDRVLPSPFEDGAVQIPFNVVNGCSASNYQDSLNQTVHDARRYACSTSTGISSHLAGVPGKPSWPQFRFLGVIRVFIFLFPPASAGHDRPAPSGTHSPVGIWIHPWRSAHRSGGWE